MKIIKTAVEFSLWRKNRANSLGFVPTLGALHQGHFSLIKASKQKCSLTVVSIFLNPTQFSFDEDLAAYPNTLDTDIQCLEDLNVNVLFLPSTNEMYKNVAPVHIPVSKLFNKLEGTSRPHFFSGVTTIVAKLFNVIRPSYAFFGEKDAQQLFIIQQMIKTMNYPIVLVPGTTIRDKNGLALSSRNQYLTLEEQEKASIIYKGLRHLKTALDNGETNSEILKKKFKKKLFKTSEIKIDYISISCVRTLDEVARVEDRTVLISAAVFFNGVRLIDNFIYSSSTT